MNTLAAESPVKFHASLNVSDLAASVAFYRRLLGVDPAKHLADYAKFELESPPLVLSLIPGRTLRGGNLNHLGLRVPDVAAVHDFQLRVESAGIRTQREDGVECCHATQTKFWVEDPDGAVWEIYVLHADTDESEEHAATNRASDDSFAREVAREKVIWRHQLGEPVTTRIASDDNSVDEVVLEGTINGHAGGDALAALLAEGFRILRPGGEVRIHGLAADSALPDGPLALPGPAAAVERVPTATEPMAALRAAGFAGVRFEILSAKAHFEIAGIGLREVLLVGRKPGHRPKTLSHGAVYLGPLALVADDFGNTFARGERVALNVHDWLALKNGPIAGQFLLLAPPPRR